MSGSVRDLANLDTDIGQMWSRIIQDAFKNGLEMSCDLIHGERLAGGSEQGIYAASDTQNYVLGTRRVTPDGRVFRYGRCYDTLTAMNRGVKNYRCLVSTNAAICLAAAIGSETIEVTTAGFTITDGKVAADELQGGYISLYRGTDRQQRLIVGNTAVPVLGASNCVITLKDPLVTAINLGDSCEISANPYDQLSVLDHNYTAVMGMPTCLATAGQYFWIQTWGPCRISPMGVGFGAYENEFVFVFGSNGGLHSIATSIGLGYSQQIAGFVMERSNLEEASVAPFIMLQISP